MKDVSIAEEDVKVINIRGVIQEPVNASALDENYEEEEEAADSNNVELTNGEKQNQETDYIMYEWTPTETSADKAPSKYMSTSKQEIFNQGWFNVGPALQTVGQH